MMKIAIPSHKRRNLIEQKTIQMLIENKIDLSSVDVFVSDQQDYDDYISLEKRYGVKIVFVEELKSIVEKFNFIHSWYPIKTEVVVIEDDIDELCIKIGENKLGKFTLLSDMAKNMFESCRENGTKLWGISSNANPFYMKNQVSYGFKFVVANVFGFISTRDRFLKVSQVCKSDYERTLLYFVKYGGICRMDGVCAITKNYKNSGGLQLLADRAVLESEACHNIVRRFGHLVEINNKKSEISKYMELKLKPVRVGKKITDWMGLQTKIDQEIMKCELRSEGILARK